MEDCRVWSLEESLWTGSPEHYREVIDNACAMVLPQQPFVFIGEQAIETVANSPRWLKVVFSQQHIERPQDGLIVIAYRAAASREHEDDYVAFCTTTMRRLEHDVWSVVQHQQMPPPVVSARL